MNEQNANQPSTVQLINPPDLSPAIGFAHVSVAGNLVWVGGQIATDSSGKLLHPRDAAAQFRQAMSNVASALAAAGCRPREVVKLTYYVTDVAAYRAALKPIGEAYRAVFGKHYPASTLVEVNGLFEPDALVEIEAIAVRGA